MNKFALLTSLFAVIGAVAAENPPSLRWGTDPTGGAPFIYQDERGNYTGFEFEVAEYLAKKLGRTSQLVAGDWANLPQQLNKPADVEGGIDMILNGYEYRQDLAETYGVTRPYYIYRLALLVKKDSPIREWKDMAGKSVGVLGGTAAHDYLNNNHADATILSNPDVANVIKLVSDGRLDATVQDSPAAIYFANEYKDLHIVGTPPKPGYYVIYYRKKDEAFGKQLDAAIADGIRDGTFEKIYRKYHVWDDDQKKLAEMLDQPWPPAEEAGEKVNPWPRLIPELLKAAGMTILLAVVSFPLALMIGFFVGMARVYGPRWLSITCGVYVEVLRGTPLLLQLFCIYYMIPELIGRAGYANWIGWLSPFVAGIIGLAINYSAYEAEIYRAGFLAVPKGQMEAALSLGMTRWTAIRRVTAPQAFRIVIPPVTNDFIALFKDTSACSIIFVTELTRKYNELFNFNRSLIVELAFLTAGLYLMMSYPLALLARRLERRMSAPKEVGP